jgi:hypothetical protein
MLGGTRCGLLIKPFSLFNDMHEGARAGATHGESLARRPFCSGIFMVHGAPEPAHGRFQIV